MFHPIHPAQVFPWAPDSTANAYIDNEQSIVIMNVVQGQIRIRINDAQLVLALAWSPNGSY